MRQPPTRLLSLFSAGLAAGALAGCQSAMTTSGGPSRLAGQNLDAAVALYGAWSEQAVISGREVYIWRRTLVRDGSPAVCELTVELGFRQIIRIANMRGVPDACRLFATRTESLTR
jgi:hypothetical protein